MFGNRFDVRSMLKRADPLKRHACGMRILSLLLESKGEQNKRPLAAGYLYETRVTIGSGIARDYKEDQMNPKK